MSIENTKSNDGIVNFINSSINNALENVNTANMSTITAISDDKKLLDVIINTTKEELFDVPL